MADKLIPTPSQTVGPFFHLGLVHAEWGDLTADNPQGQRITIEGRVIDGDGAPVPDALIEVWQANAAGRYNHPDDQRDDKQLDPHFRGFGRVATNAEGCFRLVTIKPGPVPGRGNTWQAPHINVALFARGLLKHLYTRIYFGDEAANAGDPLLSSIDDEAARHSLLAHRAEGDSEPALYRFDIVMQGEGETAFLDI
ncbi:MAG TPA: protocatechuate 3,4-dioxygenase subunit alpha [Stellaceae bacterium]|jgi:protocatechuate 3,4-dioxygenase alpha subunit|nr:protocatechuate 3,4-dioxygenase subunit alpha [Stellaceae bacterium]